MKEYKRAIIHGTLRLKSGEVVNFEADTVQESENGGILLRDVYFCGSDGERIGPFTMDGKMGETKSIQGLETRTNK